MAFVRLLAWCEDTFPAPGNAYVQRRRHAPHRRALLRLPARHRPSADGSVAIRPSSPSEWRHRRRRPSRRALRRQDQVRPRSAWRRRLGRCLLAVALHRRDSAPPAVSARPLPAAGFSVIELRWSDGLLPAVRRSVDDGHRADLQMTRDYAVIVPLVLAWLRDEHQAGSHRREHHHQAPQPRRRFPQPPHQHTSCGRRGSRTDLLSFPKMSIADALARIEGDPGRTSSSPTPDAGVARLAPGPMRRTGTPARLAGIRRDYGSLRYEHPPTRSSR